MEPGLIGHAPSGDILADRRYAYAQAAAAADDPEAAADLLRQTLERVPAWAPAWLALGLAELALSRSEPAGIAAHREAAAQAFAEAAALDPQDRLGAGLHLARLAGASPPTMPAAYVADLFDQYAPRFDAHLTEALGYRAPAVLRRRVEAACAGRKRAAAFDVMIDLGCGTGLAGAAFRDATRNLTGVDLSPAMIAAARGKAIYDRLAVGDLVGFLAAEPASSAGLIVAADVFVYVGDLAPALAAARRVLAAAGLLAFTLQTGEAPTGYALGDDLRYAHSAAYVRAAAANAALAVVDIEAASTRRERGIDVPGLAVVLAAA